MVLFKDVVNRRRLRLIALWMFVIGWQPSAIGQPIPTPVIELRKVVYTEWGLVDDVRSAWADDAVGVHHSAPFVNSLIRQFGGVLLYVPECTIKNDGYATSPSDPGRKLHHAILLGAFLHKKEVQLTLQGCSYDRPRIIAVTVR